MVGREKGRNNENVNGKYKIDTIASIISINIKCIILLIV